MNQYQKINHIKGYLGHYLADYSKQLKIGIREANLTKCCSR